MHIAEQVVCSNLQAVLQRKLVVPEVYDIMTRVQEMMVRSQSAPIRQLCASVLLQFLLDYPVGDRRLQQHLHFVITNLSYEHETGREAAIEMLKVSHHKRLLPATMHDHMFVCCMLEDTRVLSEKCAWPGDYAYEAFVSAACLSVTACCMGW